MTKRSILIKAYINKTIIFVIIGLLILSCVLNHMGVYNSHLQMTLGELVVLLFLGQNLLTKKCNYSLITILILMFMSAMNIVYINTEIPILNAFYSSIIPIIVYAVSGIMFIRYCIEQISEKKRQLEFKKKFNS